jgi:Ca2+/Na+ antiporter
MEPEIIVAIVFGAVLFGLLGVAGILILNINSEKWRKSEDFRSDVSFMLAKIAHVFMFIGVIILVLMNKY